MPVSETFRNPVSVSPIQLSEINWLHDSEGGFLITPVNVGVVFRSKGLNSPLVNAYKMVAWRLYG